jgi:6-phosphogluconolactonase
MSRLTCFVGCLNRETPYFQGARGKGIAILSFDDETGALDQVGDYGGVDNPTYLTVHQERGLVFATSEVFEWNEGDVTALRHDPAAQRLVYLSKQPTLGNIAAYASIDRGGRFVLVANYGWGDVAERPGQSVAVFPIREDGGLGPAVASVAHRGTGPNPDRQERAHAHSVLMTPDNRHAVVADLGTDRMVVYRFDAQTGALAPAGHFALPPGSGPRHFAFHPNGRLAFVIAELGSRILSLRFDPADAAFSLADDVPAVPEAEAAHNHCADLHVAPDGRFVYGSNRGHDSIVIVAVDEASGRLRVVGHQKTGGETPRNFALSPSGRHLLVANQNGDSVVVFARDRDSGLLRETGHRLALGTPMCIKFA